MQAHPFFEHIKRSTTFTIILSFLLVAIKVCAFALSESLAIQASLLDSSCDFLMSVFNLLVARYAMQPADEEHRFGHGKAEAIAAFAQAPVFMIAACLMIYHAILHLIHPEVIVYDPVSIFLMVVGTFITFAIMRIQSHTLSHVNSLAVESDHNHYRADFYTNISVLVCIIFSKISRFPYLDALLGATIGIFFLKNSFEILKKSFHILMDKELPDDIRQSIIEVIGSHPQVKGHHKLRTHESGYSKIIIQLHLELEITLSLFEAHAISDEVEQSILKKWPHADVLIHIDSHLPVTPKEV